MKFVNELFELYRGRLQGTEDDLDMITLTVLGEMTETDILSIIGEMPNEELAWLFRVYLYEGLKEKFNQDQIPADRNRLLH
ncbi:DUF6154 family protein [Domibacillus sp. 8LH]|uniref:DUF6154 family protein n=1 Tax=Domibacillus TaxID=1433999 RepID=UPI001F560000|nr:MULTISPECIES: DUF6154 family protein [Domibacillus]MCI2254258.1 DUF6154 family protein [Domibacillus sp. PGB-M46]MCM3787027.1 DUF6154 family protein [Domibacillus indicus]WNS81672.1 DUF6154 family protein [Domibacillus sp. DTU_2020_1001157_1_SI_ALB_TIR_016]